MSYRLIVSDPKGKTVIKTFTPQEPGIGDGFIAKADPYLGCDSLEFVGVPDLVPVQGNEIVQALIQSTTGFKSVFYGAFIKADTGKASKKTKPYAANARELLLGSACPPLRYRGWDTAAIAFDVATKSKHAALSVRPQDFVTSGTTLDSFDTWQTDGTLAGVLDALVAATESPDYGSGVDPSGGVYFRPNTTVLELPYATSNYEDLEMTATTTTTAVLWTLFEEPYGQYGGAYKPIPFSHTSISDAEAHERYGYTRARKLPAYAIEESYSDSFTSSNFSNAAGAASGGTGAAVRGSGTGTYTLSNDDPLVMGMRIKYQTSEDAGTVRFRASCGVLYDVELPNTRGEVQTLDLTLTPHEGSFTKWDTFRLTAASGGTMSLFSFVPLRVNTDLLDQTAPLVVPEQRPGQFAVPGVGVLPAYIKAIGAPRGDEVLPCAGLTWTWNKREGAATVFEIGQSAAEADAQGRSIRVRGFYRRPPS